MPLLACYFEFANREYLLDRVTIWYALDYFKKIASYIQFGHLKSTKSDVDINIFDGDKNYFVCSTGITELYDNAVFIQRYLFGSTDNLQYNEKNLSVDAYKLVILLKNIKESGILQNIRDAAIYIAYNNPNNSAEKTALSRYCDFMYALTSSQPFDYKNNHIMNMVAKENPNNYDFNYFKSKLKLIQKEKEIAINNSKAGKKEKDAFLHYFKKYANNAGDLNLSLIFNKIKIKGKDNSANDARYIQISSNINNKNIVKSNDLLFSRNQKLSTSNSNDNIFSVSQKIKSKNMNESTILTKKNNFKILKSKKCSANLLNNEIDKNENIQIKPYTERKIVNKSI